MILINLETWQNQLLLSSMLDKNNSRAHILIFLFFTALTLYLNPGFDFTVNSLKHWSTYNRDDIVFVYGTLIYNEGYEQHHLDHPSLFTFIFSSIFYKIFYFFGFLEHYTLSGFIESGENKNFSLSKLFFVSKFTILFFSLFTILILYKIFFILSSNKLNSFLLTLLFICSTGFISSSNRLESGLISFFLLICSIYFFLKFINYKHKSNIIFFILAFVFLFSSMMQKKIIYFCIPFLLFGIIPIIKKNNINYINYKKIIQLLSYKILLILFYLGVIFFITYKTIINNTYFLSRDLDFIFLTLNYFGLNLILFLYIKHYQNKNYENLLTFNIVIGSIYFIYKYFLIYFLSAPIAIWSISFTNFMGHLNMFVDNGEIKGALSFDKTYLYINYFLKYFKLVIVKYFLSFSFQSFLIWTNIMLFIFNYKKIENLKKNVILIVFFGFFLVQSIIQFRYEQDTYFLNSEILLIFPLIYLFEYAKVNKKLTILLILIIASNNISVLNSIKFSNTQSYCGSILENKNFTDYYNYWTQKIPKKVLLKFCDDKI